MRSVETEKRGAQKGWWVEMTESHIERIVDRSKMLSILGALSLALGLGVITIAAVTDRPLIYPLGSILLAVGVYSYFAVGVTVLRDRSFEVMLFPAPRRRAAYNDVVEYSHRSQVTFGEAGGVGWRAVAPGHRALVMNPGPGVELLLLRSGERLTVSGKSGEALYDRLEQGDEEPNDSDSV